MALKMKLSITGETAEYRGEFGGTYFLQDGIVNGKSHWISKSGGKAIWWDNAYSFWMFSNSEYLGSSIAGIIGPNKDDRPPHQISNGWMYSDGTNWINAIGFDIEDTTYVEGKFLHFM